MAKFQIKKKILSHLGSFIQNVDNQKVVQRFLGTEDYLASITSTKFVSSYGIMSHCDVSPSTLIPRSSYISYEYLNGLVDRINQFDDPLNVRPCSIYLCTDGVADFTKIVLPFIKKPFTLVTGDSDKPISKVSMGEEINALTNHPFLTAWFAQNKLVDHPKIKSLPIGLDFHSRWRDPLIWGGGSILPTTQEFEILNILQSSAKLSNRIPKAYCDWTVNLHRGDRLSCKNSIDLNACFFPQKALSRAETWKMQSKYAFIISPSGEGVDCHRTWEGLSLGCIPILKRYPMSDVFDHLPVVVIDDWSEINQDFLNQKLHDIQNQEFIFSKLFLRYWVNEILSKSHLWKMPKKLSLAEFRAYL
jgi:hypothetical protein